MLIDANTKRAVILHALYRIAVFAMDATKWILIVVLWLTITKLAIKLGYLAGAWWARLNLDIIVNAFVGG